MTGIVFNVEAGEVYLLWCGICAEPKDKFFVVAYTEPRLRYFLINSNPAKFQRDNAHLMEHQVPLSPADHRFLTHDSVLDCSQVLGGYAFEDLQARYAENQRIFLGRIAPGPRAALRHAAEQSQVLSARDKAAILASW